MRPSLFTYSHWWIESPLASTRSTRSSIAGTLGGMAELDLSLFGDAHVQKYLETDGEVGHIWNGAPCCVLFTTGRKSGEERRHALIYGKRGDDVLLVASKGGAPDHPVWYLNL